MQITKTDTTLKIFAGLFLLVFSACAGMEKTVITPTDPALDRVSCIVVLPFQNYSGHQNAGKVISDILATDLYASQRFNVMEWEEAQAKLQASGQTIPEDLDAETAKTMAQNLGVQAALIGTISEFSYGSMLLEIRAGLPAVAFTARLIDAKTGNPLWASALSVQATELMEPRRESINYLAQKATQSMIASLTEKSYQPVDSKNICWLKGTGAAGTKPLPSGPAAVPAPAAAPAGKAISPAPAPAPIAPVPAAAPAGKTISPAPAPAPIAPVPAPVAPAAAPVVAPAPAAAPAPVAPAAAPAGPAKPKGKVKIAVFNASGVAGLEENVGLVLLMKNWDVATLAKYPYEKTFDSTIIYYRPGYEVEVKEIEAAIPGPQKTVPTDKMAEDINITVLVGKDQVGR